MDCYINACIAIDQNLARGWVCTRNLLHTSTQPKLCPDPLAANLMIYGCYYGLSVPLTVIISLTDYVTEVR